VCVSGANGFIGRAVCEGLLARLYSVRPAVRSLVYAGLAGQGLDSIEIGEISQVSNRPFSLEGIGVVIHAAARAHVIRDAAVDPLALYRSVNVQGTLHLARQAALSGVKRFVFISSIGVNGAFSDLFRPFANDDAPAPIEDYAVSKWEAEQGLWEIASQTGMEVVVVRPPLVYGPGVKGNFARLLDLVRSGVPLPLAAVNNRRSFIGLDNLVDLLIRCVDHPKAAGEPLLVSDGQDLSTPELLSMIANAMGRPARLFPVPVPLLRLAGRALGRLNEVDRLVGSLQVDSSATRELLGWTPPVSVEEGVGRMVRGYLAGRG
jgi:nucleoside-diphosphate-sugar epimerase